MLLGLPQSLTRPQLPLITFESRDVPREWHTRIEVDGHHIRIVTTSCELDEHGALHLTRAVRRNLGKNHWSHGWTRRSSGLLIPEPRPAPGVQPATPAVPRIVFQADDLDPEEPVLLFDEVGTGGIILLVVDRETVLDDEAAVFMTDAVQEHMDEWGWHRSSSGLLQVPAV